MMPRKKNDCTPKKGDARYAQEQVKIAIVWAARTHKTLRLIRRANVRAALIVKRATGIKFKHPEAIRQ